MKNGQKNLGDMTVLFVRQHYLLFHFNDDEAQHGIKWHTIKAGEKKNVGEVCMLKPHAATGLKGVKKGCNKVKSGSFSFKMHIIMKPVFCSLENAG